ncbi:hypothetical protein TRIUR3_28407 [Triticum urartu]|uniref:Uncharacterized protein n=1 Tax=Triticum urartu TaxID=4572 RepID=M7ZRP3_TRIUA|nr:hypothetical protein TRIUR3_28407 [Triticum urartu]
MAPQPAALSVCSPTDLLLAGVAPADPGSWVRIGVSRASSRRIAADQGITKRRSSVWRLRPSAPLSVVLPLTARSADKISLQVTCGHRVCRHTRARRHAVPRRMGVRFKAYDAAVRMRGPFLLAPHKTQ